MDKKRLMAIDGNSLMYRAFYALPPLTNKKGIMTNAVYGFINMLLKLLADYTPDYLAVAFDMKGPTFRHVDYKEYKATRQRTPEDLAPQFDILMELLNAMPVALYYQEGYEADDILGCFADMAEQEGIKALLVTGDRDALQLVSPCTEVLLTKKGISTVQIYNLDELKKEYDLEPWQMIDLKALMGDSSDNIPGVPGIGEKTALKLIRQYHSLDGVFEHIEHIEGKKLRENLVNNRHLAVLSKRLATIDKYAPVAIKLEDCELRINGSPKLLQVLEQLEFYSLAEKMSFGKSVFASRNKTVSTGNDCVNILTIEQLSDAIAGIASAGRCALFADKDITIAAEGHPVYRLQLEPSWAMDELRQILRNSRIGKVVYDAKGLMHFFRNCGTVIEGIEFDIHIAAYLLNPAQEKYKIEQLIYDYLGIDINTADAGHLLLLEKIMRQRLAEQGMLALYEQIEHPLIRVMYGMEIAGFRVDKSMLEQLGHEFSNSLRQLTAEIYSMAEVEFNINSTKQLGAVLFENLGLPKIKKTKTGYSTDVEVLEQLREYHPIIEKIMDYRQVMKLNSTYVEGLIALIDPADGRIHSSFNQTVAVTGRISSTEPNLQNIPIRMECGRRIRKVFVPSDDSHLLLDADYSQIELRVLAHISQDPTFIDAFLTGQDIHRRTASEIFGVPIEEVSSEQRNSAKAVNFGIVYGISDFGLARNLGITPRKAREYIDSYFMRYPKVKEYLDRVVEEAEDNGYVTTLLGRRRYIPEIRSKNKTIRSLGQRLAMNTPIQGMAADIIKKAMNDVYYELKARRFKSILILQVHDELIIDVHISEMEEVKELVRNLMANTVELLVPLVIDIGVAGNWYDAK